MKRLVALTAQTLTFCALACAQQASGNRVVVPARNTSHPRVVNASTSNESITVKAYNGKEVIVETTDGHSRRERTVDGLRRLNIPGTGLEVEEQDNVITVRLHSSSEGGLLITVPVETSLQLRSSNGAVEVEGVHGEMDVSARNGAIVLSHVSGTVVADSRNGEVKVSMDAVDPGKPISFSTWNGGLDVTLPADFKANLKMRANQGEIYSDFEIKLGPGQLTTERADGRYRVKVDQNITGTINGGGTDASFTTYNGRILIRKK